MRARPPLRTAQPWGLVALLLGARALAAANVTVTVDPYGSRHPVNPLIYGVNFADPARLAVVPYTLNRWGGNSVTRYNWKVDVHNTASDWFFMNVPDAPLNVNNLPDGSSADQFVNGTRAAGSQPLLTVPTIGWTPKSTGLTIAQARQKRWGASIGTYGAQETNECTEACRWDPDPGAPGHCLSWCLADAGNGCAPDATGNVDCNNGFLAQVGQHPGDTSEGITPTFVTDWMTHVINQNGLAANGGLRFYALDNEPNLWHYTHRDVHPAKLTYDELWATRTVPYATAIKTRDPGAKVLGPDAWGWCDYFTSAADDCNYFSGTDRANHANTDLLEWYLEQVCANPLPSGAKLVDYLDIHYYPQGGCVDGLGCDGEDAAGSAQRLRALKELYDPTWHSEDWIGVDLDAVIQLVPRMRAIVAGSCPGLGLAVTEYRWGSDYGDSAALAQAEALAIYGREGVDLATRWTAPEAGSDTEDAFRFFLDYDLDPGNGFQQVMGDSGRVLRTAGTPDDVGVYAVHGPGGAGGQLFVLLFNHQTTSANATVSFAVPVAGPATLWRFNPGGAAPRITNVGTTTVTANGMALTAALSLPARTATLAIVGLPYGLPFGDGFETGTTAKWAH